MCGRFAASAGTDEYVEIFGVDEVVDAVQPHFNLAPTDPVPAIVERLDNASDAVVRKLVTPRWGLVPSWSKDASGAARMINARFETVAEKPAFRKAFASRRCLIPADGYYEWYTVTATQSTTGRGAGKPVKQPYFIYPADGAPFVMAGLYEFWRSPAGEWLTTCTIITTTASDSLGHLHDRMPMSVPAEHWASWLDPRLTDTAHAGSLVEVAAGLTAHPVSPLVGRVTNDGPELVAPVEALPFG